MTLPDETPHDRLLAEWAMESAVTDELRPHLGAVPREPEPPAKVRDYEAIAYFIVAAFSLLIVLLDIRAYG